MTLHLQWDQYWANSPYRFSSWAPSDRGWVRLEPHPHGMSDGLANVGWYLHYDSKKTITGRNGDVLAKAFIFNTTERLYITKIELGCEWVSSVDTAMTFIENAVACYVEKLHTL